MVKTYVAELNRGVKQRQELDKAEYYATAVENFDVVSARTFEYAKMLCVTYI